MLITNLAANMVIVLANLSIQTNTPAFQSYGLQKTIADAHIMAANWHLNESLIESNKTTRFFCGPTAHGPQVDAVFGRRYYFNIGWERQYMVFNEGDGWRENAPTAIWGSVARDCNITFKDLSYCWPGYSDQQFASNVVNYEVLLRRWANASNLLTLEKAEQIAESDIRSIGISMERMQFKSPNEKNQKTELSYGVEELMPYYTFTWKSDKGHCQVDVSGLSSNIAYFNFEGECPQLEFSANWFQLLGLSSNTVFVLPLRRDTYGHPLPPYRLFPYPIPMPKNRPVGLSLPRSAKTQ
jgi:hypothetical protein